MARAGLHCLRSGDRAFPELIDAFKRPRARFDAASILCKAGVRCAMDISDGLAGDACHIAEASNVSIQLTQKPRDLAPALVAYCDRYGLNPTHMALAGGEDYELLFACPPDVFDALRNQLPQAFPVGRCLPQAELPIVNLPDGVGSFQHGRRSLD